MLRGRRFASPTNHGVTGNSIGDGVFGQGDAKPGANPVSVCGESGSVQGNYRMVRETESRNGTRPYAGLSQLAPIALKCLPQRPSVSVLITCFNYGVYVGQAIESALEQTYPPAEIIVSDDASHDNSCEVVESYISRGYEIQLLRNPHGGMAANLNAAYRNSSGDMICLLDADDTFLPGKIEAMVNVFRGHPGAGFAIHRASLIDNQKRARGVYPLFSALPSGDCARAPTITEVY